MDKCETPDINQMRDSSSLLNDFGENDNLLKSFEDYFSNNDLDLFPDDPKIENLNVKEKEIQIENDHSKLDSKSMSKGNDLIHYSKSLQNISMFYNTSLSSSFSLPVLCRQKDFFTQPKIRNEKLRGNVLQRVKEIEATGQKAAVFGNKVVIHGSMEYFKEREKNRKAVQNSRARSKVSKTVDKSDKKNTNLN